MTRTYRRPSPHASASSREPLSAADPFALRRVLRTMRDRDNRAALRALGI